MNRDDPLSSEVLRVMGGLESAVGTLNKQMDYMSENLKALTTSCQNFDVYSRTRANLPDRIYKLEEIMQDYLASKTEQEKLVSKVEFLVKRYDAAMVGAVVINALILCLAWLVQRNIIKVGF